MLPEASYWAIGAFEDVGQSTKFPLRTISILLLPTESFSKHSPGRKKSLLQGMEPCLGDTSQQTPKSHSTSAGAGEDADPSLPATQRGHAFRGVQKSPAALAAAAGQHRTSEITALSWARCLGPALQPESCSYMPAKICTPVTTQVNMCLVSYMIHM